MTIANRLTHTFQSAFHSTGKQSFYVFTVYILHVNNFSE